MATTFNVISLGVLADMDTVNGDLVAENADALEGLTIGTASDPLYGRIQTLSPGTSGYSGGSDAIAYEPDEPNESFSIDGGADQSYDMGMAFDATLSYADGSTANITAVVFQDHDGKTYLAPKRSYDADQAAMEAQPIVAITLDSAIYAGAAGDEGYGLAADRYDGSFATPSSVDGTSGDDGMKPGYADADGDTIDGADGDDDTIYGYGGNDEIHAGAGDDILDGGAGDDILAGDAGDDTFIIAGDAGKDTITGGETGETGGDTLAFTGKDGVKLELTGDEAGYFGAGQASGSFTGIETIETGAGDDAIDLSAAIAGTDVTTGLGADTIVSGRGADTIDLGAGAADGAADILRIYDGSGQDRVLDFDAPTDNGDGSFTGTDRIDVSLLSSDGGTTPVTTADVRVGDDGAGNAVLSFPGGESVTLVGIAPAAFDDPDALVAIGIPDGRDHIVEGSAGADTIDTAYTGDPDGDRVDAGDNALGNDDDVIFGFAGADMIHAGDGADTVYGGDGDDQIHGDAGNDRLDGGAGRDYIWGHTGNDTITGGAGTDFLYGDEGDDVLYGGDDLDVLFGGQGADTLYGEGGDDIFIVDGSQVSSTDVVGGETDEVTGDYLYLPGDGSATTAVEVTFSGDEAGKFDDGTNSGSFVEIERVATGHGDDTIDASAATAATDIDAGAGADVVTGGTGADTILGGDGDDTITGGAGDDTITGGTGNDTFVFADGDGADRITDFDLADDDGDGATNDQLDLTALTDAGGNPVNIWDVTISDTVGDGSGDAILTFPNGESLTLAGVDPAELDAPMMRAMGVPCLAAGTLIDTPAGGRPVEQLRPGDPVITLDGGTQPIAWTASRRLDAAALAADPRLRPVRIRAGALGNWRDLLVSPQHRIALGPRGAPTGFAPARWLADDADGRFRVGRGRREVTYVHLLLAQHAVIRAEGAWVESFYPGPQGLAALDPRARASLFRRFPALAGIRSTADARELYGPLALAPIRRRDLGAFLDSPPQARAAATGADPGAISRAVARNAPCL